jgi:5-methylcytosine-specific restriction endonuclease McrA
MIITAGLLPMRQGASTRRCLAPEPALRPRTPTRLKGSCHTSGRDGRSPMIEKAFLAALLLLASAFVFLRLRAKRYAHRWTVRFVASPEFLRTPEWRRVRYDALRAKDGRCELCGRNKPQLPPGKYLTVDHAHSRRARCHLALKGTNLAVLCSADNAGKGNRYADDWRHPSHPHRQRA